MIRYVQDALKKLLTGYGKVDEYGGYSDHSDRYEPSLFPRICAYVCNFLMKNGVDVKETGVPSKKSCGTEGCAYFYDDRVLKCTLGKDEWKIATMLKGDNDVVPVIDTDQHPTTKVYLILSWRLNTAEAEAEARAGVIDNACRALSEWFDDGELPRR